MRPASLKCRYSYESGGGEVAVHVFVHHIMRTKALVELREDVSGYRMTDNWMRGALKGTVILVPLTSVRFTD
jgi:hypothetical protein